MMHNLNIQSILTWKTKLDMVVLNSGSGLHA
jgi:hypothetical protein